MKRVIICISMIASLASSAPASDSVSIDKGKELFKSTHLGTNGKSCDSCHPDGKRLTNAFEYDDVKLGEIINQCITKPLKGKALDPSSTEMKSLIMYIKNLHPSLSLLKELDP